MLTITNDYQQNLNFDARVRMRKSKSVLNKPVLLSYSGLLSTGFLSGNHYALYGIEAFKPSVVKEKVIKTKETIFEGVSNTNQKIKNGYHRLKEKFGANKEKGQ